MNRSARRSTASDSEDFTDEEEFTGQKLGAAKKPPVKKRKKAPTGTRKRAQKNQTTRKKATTVKKMKKAPTPKPTMKKMKKAPLSKSRIYCSRLTGVARDRYIDSQPWMQCADSSSDESDAKPAAKPAAVMKLQTNSDSDTFSDEYEFGNAKPATRKVSLSPGCAKKGMKYIN